MLIEVSGKCQILLIKSILCIMDYETEYTPWQKRSMVIGVCLLALIVIAVLFYCVTTRGTPEERKHREELRVQHEKEKEAAAKRQEELRIRQTEAIVNGYIQALTMKDTQPAESVDPKTISPSNTGVQCDLDGDGLIDHVMWEGDVVWWQRGNKDGTLGQRQNLFKFANTNTSAYNFYPRPGQKLPSFHFWDKSYKGHFMPNLGSVDGTPRFGNVEDQ
jgi:hypothetical protein